VLPHRGEAGESGAGTVVGSWRGEGTARRLKLAILAGLEFGRTWRVPRTSVAEGVWSRSRNPAAFEKRTSAAEAVKRVGLLRHS
jgi:hypothetical protein